MRNYNIIIRIINLYNKGEKFLNESDDAKKFIKKIANKKKTIVIKDSYRFGYKWEKIVSKLLIT